MNDEKLLSVEHLDYYYEDGDQRRIIFDDANISFNEGTFYTILGSSGSGKTTFLSLIAGLDECKMGNIYYQGKDIKDIGLDVYRRDLVSMVFQSYNLINYMNAYDNVTTALDIAKKKYTSDQIYGLLNRFGITKSKASRKVNALSGGEQQRVAIARAICTNTKLIIADECISALDVSIQAQVVNMMKDLQEELGTTYLFIAHDLSMVKYISDRIGVMHLGHIVETGTTDEIFFNPIHPYTKSLLSAIPHPNPVVEKTRTALSYDKDKEGVDYTKGTYHSLSDTHVVLATDEEFTKWNVK